MIDGLVLPLLAAVAVMIVSLSGVVFIHHTARQFLEERLAHLVSFSAGVFAVTAGALALESFELFSSALVALGWIGAGYVLAWGLHYLLPETHHHHDGDCHRTHGGARKLLIGDGIHNIADGIILVPAFAVSPTLGLAVTVSVLVHEALQEVSEFFVLRQAGVRTAQALVINFAVSSTILLGVGVGYLALSSLALEGVLLALSAGFFVHVVVHDLLPKRSQHTGSKLAEHVLLVALGIIAMASVQVLAGGAHIHGGEPHEHEHEHISDEHHHADDEHHHDEEYTH